MRLLETFLFALYNRSGLLPKVWLLLAPSHIALRAVNKLTVCCIAFREVYLNDRETYYCDGAFAENRRNGY